MPYVRHVCVLLPLVMPHKRHAHLGLYIAVSLKGRVLKGATVHCLYLTVCYLLGNAPPSI